MGQSTVPSEIKAEVPLQNENPSHHQILCQQYEERIKSLSQGSKVSKFCLEAGFVHVVEVGQYFMTKDTGDFRQFRAVACREYTLPRDDESSQPRRWIQGNTRIGLVLEVVKSIPPNTENWLRKLNDKNYNNDTSNEDKHETNYSMNNDTRNMHISRACIESAQSLSHFVHLVSHAFHGSSLSLAICHPCTCASLLEFDFLLFYFDLSFPVFFSSFHLLHFELPTELDNLIAMQNLRYSANKGSDDAYDVHTSLTSYEPNFMAFSELNDSSGSFSYIIPSSDQDIDDVTLGKLLTEAHRGQADYCDPEGVSVSQSSSSVVFDRAGKLAGERDVDQSIGFGVTRNTYSAHSKFSENTPAEKVVDRSGKPEERDSSNAQIKTLLEEQRQMIIAEYCEKIGHHQLQTAHAEEERRILREELWRQQMDFREVHQKSLTEMEELRKFQSSTFDTLARRKLIEDQNTILELSGRVQELQNEVNCMNDF